MALADVLREAGFSDEEISTQLSAFDPKFKDTLEKSTMRQADYSRGMDELKKTKSTLETNWQKANDAYIAMQNDTEATKRERDEVAKKLKEAEEKLTAAPAIDEKKMQDAYEARLRDFASGSTAFMGDVLEIGDEHRELFGERLNRRQFMQDALAAGKTPQSFWEEKYNPQAKRDEIAKKADEERIAAIRKEEREKAIAEFQNPATRPLQDSQNPFTTSTAEEEKQPWDVDYKDTPAYKNAINAAIQMAR